MTIAVGIAHSTPQQLKSQNATFYSEHQTASSQRSESQTPADIDQSVESFKAIVTGS